MAASLCVSLLSDFRIRTDSETTWLSFGLIEKRIWSIKMPPKRVSVDTNANEIESTNEIKYIYRSHIRDSKGKDRNVYCVQFNYFLEPTAPKIFTSIGGCRVYVYECTTDGAIKLLQCYGDPDTKEKFYTACWARTDTISAIVVAGGKRGVIRLIDATAMKCVHSFIGHTAAINDVKVNPKDPSMLLSASEDHSIRLWSIATRVNVAIFGGYAGHRDQVISIDFDSSGNRFISGSMDHSLQIWDLTKPKIKQAIEQAKVFNAGHYNLTFNTLKVHAADFVTREVHYNYVDCVNWFGDLFLSKSSGDPSAIVCWQPHASKEGKQPHHNHNSVTILHEFETKNCDYWYMRFNLNYDRNLMAAGTIDGQIYVWNLDNADPKKVSRITLKHLSSRKVMRQPAFSRDGNVLICGDDSGTIWRWDRTN